MDRSPSRATTNAGLQGQRVPYGTGTQWPDQGDHLQTQEFGGGPGDAENQVIPLHHLIVCDTGGSFRVLLAYTRRCSEHEDARVQPRRNKVMMTSQRAFSFVK